MKLALALLLFAPIASADTIFDTPKPKKEHNFYDRTARFQLIANASLLAGDAKITCHNLGRGGREVGLPTQSCPKAIGLMLSFHAAQESLAFVFHKTHHHKLERLTRFYMTEAHTEALIRSKLKGAF